MQKNPVPWAVPLFSFMQFQHFLNEKLMAKRESESSMSENGKKYKTDSKAGTSVGEIYSVS
jgi:hypothetical protein